MADNIFVDSAGEIILIDFQDMSLVSPVRDIVSLINDRGIDELLGQSLNRELFHYAGEKLQIGDNFERFYNEYLLHWDFRVSGRFALLSEQKGMPKYAKWIPGTLRRLGRTMERSYKDFVGMDDLLEILPNYTPEVSEGIQDAWPLTDR